MGRLRLALDDGGPVPNSDPLRDSVAALSQFFVGDGTIEQTLQRVVDLAATAVPAAAMTGITLLVDGRPTTAVCSDETAIEIDQAQYESGSGPCLDAFRDETIYRIDSTPRDTRWPEFCESAAEHGILSTLSIPLMEWSDGLGALNFYARHEAAFSEDDGVAGGTFASQAAMVLANAQAYWEAFNLSENLAEAMKSRAVIEQAKGILMARERVDADTAFEMLKRASQRTNRKLRDLAAEIVDRTGTPPAAGA